MRREKCRAQKSLVPWTVMASGHQRPFNLFPFFVFFFFNFWKKTANILFYITHKSFLEKGGTAYIEKQLWKWHCGIFHRLIVYKDRVFEAEKMLETLIKLFSLLDELFTKGQHKLCKTTNSVKVSLDLVCHSSFIGSNSSDKIRKEASSPPRLRLF